MFTVEKGATRLIGLITGQVDPSKTGVYGSYSDKHPNKFQLVSDILANPAVKDILEADKARFGNRNSAIERPLQPLPGFK